MTTKKPVKKPKKHIYFCTANWFPFHSMQVKATDKVAALLELEIRVWTKSEFKPHLAGMKRVKKL